MLPQDIPFQHVMRLTLSRLLIAFDRGPHLNLFGQYVGKTGALSWAMSQQNEALLLMI